MFIEKSKQNLKEHVLAPVHVELYAGTAGHSAWFSADLGQSWLHPNSHSGMYLEARVWALGTHPADANHLYAGTDMGLFRWDERRTRWALLPSPMADVWAVAQSPADPRLVVAGTRPAGLYRSADAGANWEALSVPHLARFSDVNLGATRVTQILFDPVDAGTLWATVEVGGIFRSRDGGTTWTAQTAGLVSMDIHGIAIIRNAAGRKTLFATTNLGLHKSTDDGESWVFQPLASPWQYTRAIVARCDSDAVLFLTNGNGPPGSTGRLLRSTDYGEGWAELALPGQLNSTPWCVATHPHDPMLVFVGTNLGQLFRSTDGGDSWERLPQEFGELRSLHWRPTAYPADRPAHSITVRKSPVAA